MNTIISKLLAWATSTSAEGFLGAAIKYLIGWLLGSSFDEARDATYEAIQKAQLDFHDHFGSAYGPAHSTFIEQQTNQVLLLRSTFPRSGPVAVEDLDPRGFDGASAAPREALQFFLTRFNEHLAQSKSRILDRDLALREASPERKQILQVATETKESVRSVGAQVSGAQQELHRLLREKILPDPIRAAIADPDLSELSVLMKTGKAREALQFATRRIGEIDRALESAADPGGFYAEALRTHRQRLLFAAASAASWQGDLEAGRAWWQRARDLGPIDSEWLQQAVHAAYNVGLVDEFRHLLDKMEPGGEAYRSALPLLADLAKDWLKVDELLQDAQGSDLILARVRARLESFNPLDLDAIRTTEHLLNESEQDQSLAILQISRARLTLGLLQRVVEEYTPLDYDRAPLVENLTRRAKLAVETTEPNTLLRAQALAVLGSTAEVLRDRALGKEFDRGVEELDEKVRTFVFFRYDPAPSPDAIEALLAARQIEPSQAILLRASYFRATNQTVELERELRAGLYSSSDARQRAQVVRLLIQHLDSESLRAQADTLIEQTPLRPADRWLLRSERLSPDEHPLDLSEEVEAFPLDLHVLERLTLSTLSRLRSILPEDPPADLLDQGLGDAAVYWAKRFAKALPSRSAKVLYAEALYAARRYEELLAASTELDPFYADRSAELHAWALQGLGRGNEAADVLLNACVKFPTNDSLAANASAMLLAESRAQEAAALLESRVEGATSPAILLHYAHALVAQAPTSRKNASEAFDLLVRAYDLQPDARIAAEAWKAGRGAGREREARPFFAAMVEAAPRKVVRTEADLDEVFNLIGEKGHNLVQIEGGVEALAQVLRRDRARTDALGQLSSAHLVAYTDLLALAGRPWEHWTQWTQQFHRNLSEGRSTLGRFSVLVDWPSPEFEHARRQLSPKLELFADPTAILTLGMLGPDPARTILDALGELRIAAGTINDLQEETSRILGEILVGGDPPYAEAVAFLRRRSDAIVPYTEDLEAAAPDDTALGAARVDLGVAVAHRGYYVTDLKDITNWSKEALELRITSPTLLATLRTEGIITAGEATKVSEQSPGNFEGWETATPIPLPDCLVFDEFALLAWVKVHLADSLGSRVMVGPWAWSHLSESAERQEVLAAAHERLIGLISLLRESIDAGVVLEVELVSEEAGAGHSHNQSPEAKQSLRRLWTRGLASLRTAQKNELQLWADDRFYPLLLWRGGLPLMGLEISELRGQFASWAHQYPPLSTFGVLASLTALQRIDPEVAEDTAAVLFQHGYRPAHPILLNHVVRQYGFPSEPTVTPPFQKLVAAVAEIPNYLPQEIEEARRNGFTRMAAVELAQQLILKTWQVESVSDDHRRVLADSLLEELERVFRHASAQPTAARSDRAPLLFWRSIAMELLTAPEAEPEGPKIRSAALQWLGAAAARRVDQLQDIVRLLEDNALDALQAFHGDVPDSSLPSEVNIRHVAGLFASRALIPLFESELLWLVDPVLRRTVGTLAGQRRGGRVDVTYGTEIEGKELLLTVTEEEKEEAAVEVLRRAYSGDPKFGEMIHATDVVFRYTRAAPAEWIKEGIDADAKLPVDVRCSLFTLLWADPPELRNLLVRLIAFHVAALDPALAHDVVRAEASLVSEDEDIAQEAREKLAVDLLRSGYFDLQRDLGHAIYRFRDYEEARFTSFLGWIGEEAAHNLIEVVGDATVYQVGPLVLPNKHYLKRSIVSGRLEDRESVLEAIEEMILRPNDAAREGESAPDIVSWLSDRASTAESADDPFIAAWALGHVLVALSTVDPHLELEMKDGRISVSGWVAQYLEVALSFESGGSPAREWSRLERCMLDRRDLAASVLQLAACACSGEVRFSALKGEEDHLAAWLDRVWLLSTKLQIALVSLRGGLSAGGEAAAKAVQELGLATPTVRALDAFDPFAFGAEGDDLGIALTLMAIFKAVHQPNGLASRPYWWTEPLQRRVKEFARQEAPEPEEVGNRLGLPARLRVQTLAQSILSSFPVTD